MQNTPQMISTDLIIMQHSVVKIDFQTKLKTILSLFKPRIVILLLISAISG